MVSYKAPVEDTLFCLDDVLQLSRYSNLPRFGEASMDVVEAILTEAARFCENALQPLNRTGDRSGCVRHQDGRVTTPAGFKEAYESYCAGGWQGLSVASAYGGQNLPQVVGAAVNEFCFGANMAFTMYPGLTQSAVAALLVHGSEEQKRLYATRMVTGEWTGTMNLTEPHCGTDLGLLTTRATPRPDGAFALTGQKIFISAGEHDLAPNIIHLVLARIEGAPAGTKGLSLFLVPKVLVEPDGSLGARNAVSCGAIETKMGIHGNATCVMNYDGATGWLIGEANRGLQAMFVMMNEARIGVAIQGLGLSEVAYQNAAAYAKERLQGRALSGRTDAGKPADPILAHPDVRRMLLEVRAFNEGARALLLWGALQADLAAASEDPKARQTAEDLLGLLTPVLKGVLTDTGFNNCVTAQQVFGGHGYVAEWGVEQFVRDARIAMIYEGANGIQALDLVGRKLPKDAGRAFTLFTREVSAYLKQKADQDAMAPYLAPLKEGLDRLQQATMWFMANAMTKPDNAGAGATSYMHLLGLVGMGYMWARMAEAALARKARGASAGMDAKLTVGRIFMERLMPETATHLARITAGAETMMAMPAEAF
ncbi:acyl-CoA dehydrogenase C-terminal domain-containing protein [Lichenihabitans sp. Uapishka_5]|uniref:acyl-CoA dehydrogenase C-terminal domain-containing protein n=1 Tax=Lichenihabitans sp. Uapishka_5 TaxID=3037302 RepID=UPI0029E81F17|nr:acyl-CoA dehydrogenase C-terminal domain-containing protein [Lichenihabitans sp. Uapishka_5]MDX7952445.1 acyl-CoA dehydrogenase C-terminal domain-containing protein [Lichenihabitans sp. Uapishka_5]